MVVIFDIHYFLKLLAVKKVKTATELISVAVFKKVFFLKYQSTPKANASADVEPGVGFPAKKYSPGKSVLPGVIL